MKKIIVVTKGNALDPTTWSNVPSFVVKELEKAGYEIINVNIDIHNKLLRKIYAKLCNVITKYLKRGSLITYERTHLVKKLSEIRISNTIRKHRDAEFVLFISITPSKPIKTKLRKLLMFDFSIDYTLTCLTDVEPTKYEIKEKEIQEKTLNTFDDIFVLFKNPYEYYLNKEYRNKLHYFNMYVINCPEEEIDFNTDDLIEKKVESDYALFIGKRKYRSGAITADEALYMFNTQFGKKMKLKIIGMTKTDFDAKGNVEFFGYLNKNLPKERDTYYSLIKGAKFIVNTTKYWAGISSIVEGLWFCTPIITTKYDDLSTLIGEEQKWGFYCPPESSKDLHMKICKLFELTNEEYKKMCIEAHNVVSDYTWRKYVNLMLSTIERNDEYAKE